jgi:hypothetical protein
MAISYRQIIFQGYWKDRPSQRDRMQNPPPKKVVGLERSPLSLVTTTDELLDWKVAAPV